MQFDRVVCDSTKRITLRYGNVTLNGKPYNHKGIDLGFDRNNEELNKVYANCWGTVIKTLDGVNKGEDTGGGWGNYVLIKHPNGMCSRYAHLQKGLKVLVGTEVDESSVLGIMGDSGIVTGRHLHFEVQTSVSADSRIDPTPYLNTPIWSNSPDPVTRKFKVGDKVVLNGHLYYNSYGDGKGQMRNDYVTTIYLVNNEVSATKPYNVGNGEGWVDERNLKLYEEPEPTFSDDLKIGDHVEIIKNGKANIYGEEPTAYGIGWHCVITKIYEGYPYPYRVDDKEGGVGFYQKDALKKI